MPEHHVSRIDLGNADHRLLESEMWMRLGVWSGTSKAGADGVYSGKVRERQVCTESFRTLTPGHKLGLCTELPIRCIQRVPDRVCYRAKEWAQNDVCVGEKHIREHL